MAEKGKNENPYCKSLKKTSSEVLKELEKELMIYVAKNPKFYLTEIGKKAQIKFPLTLENNRFLSPLFMEDIKNLLFKTVNGTLPFILRWLKMEWHKQIPKTVLVEIKGLCQEDASEIHQELYENRPIFSEMLGILSSDCFASEISSSYLSTEFYSKAVGNYSSLFPMNKSSVVNHRTPNTPKLLSKLHLLLKPLDMAMECYPLPTTVFDQQCRYYSFTKDEYEPVTANSPMFALDCEMGRNASGKKEVLRIAIVDVNLDVVYHSFVKPEVEIVDYVTKFSGVTEEMLKGISTTLSDVQQEIKKIIPKDGILCGHSLGCDLHALKLIHPYVIDTSVIFSTHGMQETKLKLKTLTKKFLNKFIQVASHNPIEDSIAAMELVLFRLKNSLVEPINGKTHSELIRANGFFSKLSEYSSTVCILGSHNCIKNYRGYTDANSSIIQATDSDEIVQETIKNVENFDLVLSHLSINKSNFPAKNVTDDINLIYNKLPEKTLFMVILSDVLEKRNVNFQENLLMIVLKNCTETQV